MSVVISKSGLEEIERELLVTERPTLASYSEKLKELHQIFMGLNEEERLELEQLFQSHSLEMPFVFVDDVL